MKDLLEVRGLSVHYGAAKVVADVDISVGEGEIVGMVGRNGAGKTTTLLAISGMIPRSAGRLQFRGQALPASPERAVRLGLAHVPEGRRILRSLSTLDNLRFGAVAAGRRPGSTEIQSVLESLPALGPLLDRGAGLLSGGEQQMLAIGRGLMADPRLMMVDELSLGLAPKATVDVLHALISAARRRSMSLLLVDQTVRLLVDVCDRVVVLKHGRIYQPSDYSDLERDVYFS